ncbi:MAG: tRNA (5-methylaminomethyl-2-thiouridine)(34)-methyltransferase MnmD [Marinilabiliaceae bacterium]|nr:tRNA (5-methylaminomethyl-2-thiouridine)(34)-methyltransferase MnmD [Marinilabiliaceae bacterium]
MKDKNRKVELKISGDGSHTLYVPELEEHYHSVNGAINESMHVFIEAGLKQCQKDTISILEIGLGTGLNAYLTLCNKSDKSIRYHALEKYPVSEELANQLNFVPGDDKEGQVLFRKLHHLPWNQMELLTADFLLHKQETDLLSVVFNSTYDLVYFDAFAPEKQPEMWSDEIFSKIYQAMNSGGILTTYCAKGVIRRRLQACGFIVERLPGPKGKREMIRATKQ